ncbi:MAG: T9SS type A sorting domain-containing protein [Bacteroidia bacterium]
MISRISTKELLAWTALIIAIVLFSVSVSLAQTTTITRTGNDVRFRYSGKIDDKKVKIDTSFTVKNDDEFNRTMQSISDKYKLNLNYSKIDDESKDSANDNFRDFSYRMKIHPDIDKKTIKKMQIDIDKSMKELEENLKEMDDSFRNLHMEIITDPDDDDFSFNFSMPEIPQIHGHFPGAEGFMILGDDDLPDSLNDEAHVIVFGEKDEQPPVLENTITSKSGRQIFIYKRTLPEKQNAVNDDSGLHNLNVYPNPSNGKINITFTVPKEADVKIEIVDAAGKAVMKVVMKDYVGEYSNNFDLSRKGSYIVKVTVNNEVQTQKVLIN